MKNEENFVENLVAPTPELFGNEIVRRRNGPQRNWQWRRWLRRKVLFPSYHCSWSRRWLHYLTVNNLRKFEVREF